MKKITFVTTLLLSTSLYATNGMQPIAIGAKAKGMAGAGLALPSDALIGGYNPAGIAEVGNRFDASLSTFHPTRSYASNSEAVRTDGNQETESKNEIFFIPSMGYTKRMSDRSTIGATMYAKGGGSVAYDNTATFGNFGVLGGNTDGEGVWTYSEVQQLGIPLNYAHRIHRNHVVGGGPVIGFQRFKATGLGYFKPVSTDPDNLTDNGWDNSVGIGGAVGYLGHFGRYLDLAAAYHSEVRMTPFKKYSGLFAEGGKMDMPAQYMVGLGLHPTSKWRIGLDYHLIKYSNVPSMANSHSQALAVNTDESNFEKTVGGDDGAGFGWEDVNIYKIGTSYDIDRSFTVRAGYSFGNSPIGGEDVLFNVLAPAVTKEHLAAGLSKTFNNKYEVDFSYVRTFKNTVRGTNPNNMVDEEIALSMEQHDVELGFSMLF